ncbi:L-2-hydroxyglutarate oxidase [soil metagenome]
MKLQNSRYNIAIVGGGILGASIAYFLSSITSSSIILIEQEKSVALHTSSRNTGKVHAPFLYDPVKKKFFAKAASLGFEMWKEYCKLKSLPFVQDGVIEVATNDNSINRLNKYLVWGEANGLRRDKDVWLLDKSQVKQIEPNVSCISAILCEKDASVNYGLITQSLIQDAQLFGCDILLGNKVKKILSKESKDANIKLLITNGRQESTITTQFLINAAGGNAVDIAHSLGIAMDYTDLHFRGEYWQAPPQYQELTKRSIYSVPKYPEYPFLDPHWIVRIDGRREVGPNAVPVFGPYAYNWIKNTKSFFPKIMESIKAPGTHKILFDRQFLSLLGHELRSSLSKTVMINRVKEFLPQLNASSFKKRGTAGIRSSLVDSQGRFVSDTMVLKDDYSIHILNYNSPGATGALPMGAAIVDELLHCGIIIDDRDKKEGQKKSIWDIQKISNKMKLNEIK